MRITALNDADAPWSLSLRVPAWAEGACLRGPDGVESDATPGLVSVRRAFRAGEAVTLTLPMTPRVTHPDARIDAVRGCVAIERGPEVLALESVDLGGAATDVGGIVVAGAPTERDGRVWVPVRAVAASGAAWPYGPDAGAPAPATTAVPLVPYHDWANRGPSTMRVWIPAEVH